MVTLQAAYAVCLRDARRHYENFPVASLLVPRRLRPHVAAVYAFARAADDFADEGTHPVAVRDQLLEGWRARLQHASGSSRPGPPPAGGEPPHTVEIFLALGQTLRELALPVALLEDLLSAFRQDVHVTRYETWSDLFDYCRRSANPVGRLVLRIAGHDDARLDGWSDALCTALQLTNFWQDLIVDARRGRIYLPAAERREHGAVEATLLSGRLDAAWQQALEAAAVRTRELYAQGRPVCDAVSGRLRFELRATWLGGVRILNRLEAVRFDVVGRRPSLGLIDAPWFAWRLAGWRTSGRPPATDTPVSAVLPGQPGGRRP
jgi:hydroxysqualene synthase